MRKHIHVFLGLWLGVVAGVHPLAAQLGTATISGSVRDSTGAVIVGASVTAVNTATGFRRPTISNELGQYSLPGLTPGVYDLIVEFQGFRRFLQSGLRLQVDQNALINVILEVGEVTETVEIRGQAPLIESQTAAIGAVIDTQKILALPLNGRNFVQLALLVPGSNTGAPGAASGGGFSVSGTRSEQNAFQIDGTSNSDAFQNRISVTPNIDAIQEFKIQTSNYSAEFGKGAGAQVNLVTKSGTKEFHGTLYEFWRNDAMQARSFFDRNSRAFPCDKNDPDLANRKACAPPFNQNQFGFTLGGPVFFVPKPGGEQRTFFFTAYEGFRQRRGRSTVTTVPDADRRRGDFSRNLLTQRTVADALGRTWQRGQLFDPLSSRPVTDNRGQLRFVREPFTNNIIPLSRFDPTSLRVLSNTEFVPLPNAPGRETAAGDVVENFLDGRTLSNNFDQFSARIDHQASDNDTIYGRFTFNDSNNFNPRTFPGFSNLDNQRNLNGTLSYAKVISPTTLNELRFGYQGWFQLAGSEANFAGTDWIERLGINGLSHARDAAIRGAPSISVAGFAGWGDDGGLPLVRRNNTFQVIDNLSFNKGRHFMKVGFEVRRVRENVVRAQATRGEFAFSNPQWTGIDGVGNTGHALASMQLGLMRQKARRISDFATRLRATEYGAYVQDDFKATQNLTLNIGLRYMLYIPPKDTRDRISTLVHPLRCPSYDLPGCAATMTPESPFTPFWGVAKGTAAEWNAAPLPRSLSPVDKKNLGPRFGFAYRPFGNNRTVLRGGYGIFYDTVPLLLTEDTIENWPYVIEDQQDLGLFQNGLPPREGFFGFLIENPGLGPGPVAQFFPGPNIFSPDFRNAYVQSWNFGIQRELPGQTVLEVAYVGTKGTRLNRRQNTNTAEPLGLRATIGDLTNNPNIPDIGSGRNQFRRLVPIAVQNNVIVPLSNNFETTSTAFSNYHGMQLRFEKRYSHGFTTITTYTWSKAISDAAPFNSGGSAGTGNRIQNILDLRADKGLADLDHRHRFTTAFVYDFPFGRGRRFGGGVTGLLDRLISGWGVDGIVGLQSGYPITVRRNGDPGSIGTEGALRPNLTCPPDLPRGQQTVEKFFKTECFVAPEAVISGDVWFGTAGRATVQGPGLINLDFSARKFTQINERVRTEFRAEFFNMPNHPNFGVPARDHGPATFGRVTSTLDPRIIQFGLKVTF
jgi:hypothetical protein